MHSRKLKFLNTLENLSKEVMIKNAPQILEIGCYMFKTQENRHEVPGKRRKPTKQQYGPAVTAN